MGRLHFRAREGRHSTWGGVVTRAAIWAVIFALPVLITACGESVPPGYRYKLKLELDVGGQVYSAFNVVDVLFIPKEFPDKHTKLAVTGEAVFVDLGPGRRPLIALLTARIKPENRPAQARQGWGEATPGGTIGRAFRDEPELSDGDGEIEGGVGVFAGRGPREIEPSYLPDLVTFEDVNSPKSVMAVDPSDLQATLGPGVSWHKITLEITDEPLTTGIEEKLPWLKTVYGYLDGKHTSMSNELASSLDTGSFKVPSSHKGKKK